MAPLHNAANRGNLAEVRRLINSGENINLKGNNGWTPLMHAANKGHADVVRYLLNKRPSAALTKENTLNRSAIHLAIERGNADTVRALLRHSNLNTMDGNGRSPLVTALTLNKPRIVNMLVHAGAKIKNNNMNYAREWINNNNAMRNLLERIERRRVALNKASLKMRASMTARKNRNLAMRRVLSQPIIRTGSTTSRGIPRDIRNIIGKMVRGRK